MKKTYRRIVITIVFILILALIIRSKVLKELLYIIVIGFIIAYVLKPLHLYLINRGVNRKISAIMLVVIFVFIILTFVFFLIPSILRETLKTSTTRIEIKDFIEKIQKMLKPISNNSAGENLIITVYDKFNMQLHIIINKVIDMTLKTGENLLNIAIIPIMAYYFLADWHEIGGRIIGIFPIKYRNMVKRIIKHVDIVLSKYTISQFVLCILIGGLTFFILAVLKVDYPILLSILNGIFNIIPYFGPIFGAVPAVIVALLESPQKAIYTAACLYLVQLIEGNIISPKITGDSVDMHPLVVIILLIVGEKLGGFVGMVLVIPIAVIIKVVWEDLNYYLF